MDPATEVLNHLDEYRKHRHLAIAARNEGDASAVAKAAANCGTALRRMRKAAREYNARKAA